MSKVQGKNADLLNNLTETGIATELDSHLRDLEKNIAVAREFIKLADESYTELRHKWNLIQEEARSKSETGTSEKESRLSKKKRSATDELAETEGISGSKTEESVGISLEKTLRSEKSKSRTKHEKPLRQAPDAEVAPYYPDKLENAKSSKDRTTKSKKNKARSNTT